MRNLPIHIYGYNNAHYIIVYMVVKDMQWIRSANVGSYAIVFKSFCFGPFTLKRNSVNGALNSCLDFCYILMDTNQSYSFIHNITL